MDADNRKMLQEILRRRGGFGHREHLELAWQLLEVTDAGQAQRAAASIIRHLAFEHGAPGKYHETITRGWMKLVAVHHSRSSARSFDEFIAENPDLLDRHLLDSHYSSELLSSPEARARWAAPDLRALPEIA